MPAEATQQAMGVQQIIMLVLMAAVAYFILIRPQKKREKKTKEMIASIEKGSEIVTIGGVEGKVIQVKDDSVTIETGTDRTKMTFKKWAIRDVTEKEQA